VITTITVGVLLVLDQLVTTVLSVLFCFSGVTVTSYAKGFSSVGSCWDWAYQLNIPSSITQQSTVMISSKFSPQNTNS